MQPVMMVVMMMMMMMMMIGGLGELIFIATHTHRLYLLKSYSNVTLQS